MDYYLVGRWDGFGNGLPIPTEPTNKTHYK
jgi:hypothetical protein